MLEDDKVGDHDVTKWFLKWAFRKQEKQVGMHEKVRGAKDRACRQSCDKASTHNALMLSV